VCSHSGTNRTPGFRGWPGTLLTGLAVIGPRGARRSKHRGGGDLTTAGPRYAHHGGVPRGPRHPLPRNEPIVPESHLDDELLALTLFSTWAVLTGRTLRAAPPGELTEEELIEFWEDVPVQTSWHAPGRGRG
jgi:hypothetical protein